MDKQYNKLAGIILKSASGGLSPEEQQQLDAYLQASEANRQKYRELTSAATLEQKLLRYEAWENVRTANYQQLLQRIHPPKRRTFRPWHYAAAAAVLALLIAGILLWQTPQRNASPFAHAADIAPGKTGAVLTLADGSQVVLDSITNGVIAAQNGSQVVMKNGQLAYDPGNSTGNNIAYNTMSTPKGRQFHLTLPDGTRVWLNAASSLKYPTAFTGKERSVTVTGEAYFEVAQNASQPFKVNVPGAAPVEVLGTSFNINAYIDEEDIRATLLEGSVRIGSTILQPGQQMKVKAGNVMNADTDKVMAWKNGIFNFNDASLKEVMRQLERWYDIEVIYENGVPDTYFYGKVSRDVSLAGILKVLEATRVHFRVEGRKLIVMP